MLFLSYALFFVQEIWWKLAPLGIMALAGG